MSKLDFRLLYAVAAWGQLLDRFCQDDRVRVDKPRRSLQIKFTRPISADSQFVELHVKRSSCTGGLNSTQSSNLCVDRLLLLPSNDIDGTSN